MGFPPRILRHPLIGIPRIEGVRGMESLLDHSPHAPEDMGGKRPRLTRSPQALDLGGPHGEGEIVGDPHTLLALSREAGIVASEGRPLAPVVPDVERARIGCRILKVDKVDGPPCALRGGRDKDVWAIQVHVAQDTPALGQCPPQMLDFSLEHTQVFRRPSGVNPREGEPLCEGRPDVRGGRDAGGKWCLMPSRKMDRNGL